MVSELLIYYVPKNPIAIAMAAMNMEYNPGAIAVYTSIGDVNSFMPFNLSHCKQESWT